MLEKIKGLNFMLRVFGSYWGFLVGVWYGESNSLERLLVIV